MHRSLGLVQLDFVRTWHAFRRKKRETEVLSFINKGLLLTAFLMYQIVFQQSIGIQPLYFRMNLWIESSEGINKKD